MASPILMRVSLHAFAIVLSLASIFPLVWMVSTAFKGPTEIFTPDVRLFPHQPTLENFVAAVQDKPVLSWAVNSGVSALLITVLRLLIAVPAAYAFTRERFRFKNVAFLALVGTMIIPQVVTLIPNYQLIVQLGWINTLQGVVVLSFLDGWNLYLWPLLVLPSLEAQTLAVGMDTYASDPDTVQLWGPLMVVALLSAIPPLAVYAVAQRHLVAAFTTGLKG